MSIVPPVMIICPKIFTSFSKLASMPTKLKVPVTSAQMTSRRAVKTFRNSPGKNTKAVV